MVVVVDVAVVICVAVVLLFTIEARSMRASTHVNLSSGQRPFLLSQRIKEDQCDPIRSIS